MRHRSTGKMMAYENLLFDVKGQVARITLDFWHALIEKRLAKARGH
ncbi:MAG TPA: hypothetical protein VN884_09720 [Candidatus Sulfotelmatobacter sp.]|jgi:hypothetical protein|nr:hypothetical protein [Candidatus Sulfotelmatobacter sp.]